MAEGGSAGALVEMEKGDKRDSSRFGVGLSAVSGVY